jgi:hypothetical protein
MPGVKKWKPEEIVYILHLRGVQGKSLEAVQAEHSLKFPGHDAKISAIRYVWDKYRTDPEYAHSTFC